MLKKLLFIGLVFLGNLNLIAQEIKEVKIGDQIWMAENLNVDKFKNGDAIPEAKTKEEWKAANKSEQPAWCYHSNISSNGTKYGKLYNWYAVNDPRGLAPEGWHIPSKSEFSKLSNYLYDFVGKKLKSKSGWRTEDLLQNSGDGSNAVGFNGLPAGDRDFSGAWGAIGNSANWWTTSENVLEMAWCAWVSYLGGEFVIKPKSKSSGNSVRCVKD
jgi:uncharacterized protein (TIGR02145 family)